MMISMQCSDGYNIHIWIFLLIYCMSVVDTSSHTYNTQGSIHLSSKDVMTKDDNNYESLSSLLNWILNKELSDCSLLLVIDQIYINSPTIQQLMVTLHHPKQIVLINNTNDLLEVLWTSRQCRVYVFFLHDPKFLLSFGNQNFSSWDYYGKYIIVGLNVDELEDFTDTKKGKKTQHIIGIVKSNVGDEWKIYMNELFTKQRIVFISVWKRHQFTRIPMLFPDKISNLNGATLNVVTFEFPPAVIYDRTKGIEPYLYGRDVEVVRALSMACNFTIKWVQVPDGEFWGEHQPNGNWTGQIGMLGSGAGDLGIANIFITTLLGRKDYQHFTSPYHQSVNCVMLGVAEALPRWHAPVWPFTQDTWIALAIALLISGPLLYILSLYSAKSVNSAPYLESLTLSYLQVASMHLKEPVTKEPHTSSSRVLVAFLWIYGMVLGISYSCNLTAFLTVTRQPDAIDTFKDLHASNLKIVAIGPLFGNLMKRSSNFYLKELYKSFVPILSDPESWVLDGRGGYISSRHYIEYTTAQLNSQHRKPIVTIMKECTWPFSVGVGLQSNSPLKPSTSKIVDRIVQSGLVSYWFDDSVRYATKERRMSKDEEEETEDTNSGNVVPLNIDHMQGIFYILVISYLSSLIIFAIELYPTYKHA